MHGVQVKEVAAGKSCPLAFVSAFFGFWPQHVRTALEVEQRCENFRLGEEEVMLATVNALSFPLYLIPFGAVVAKLGEYMNQCPIYVAGRDFHFTGVILSVTYAAEYVLVLFTCSELLDSAEQGYPTGEDALTNAEDEWVFHIFVCWLCLTLVRAEATGVCDHFRSSPRQVGPEEAGSGKQDTGSLGVVSCQSSRDVSGNKGIDSVSTVSYQSSKAEDSSHDVNETQPTEREV